MRKKSSSARKSAAAHGHDKAAATPSAKGSRKAFGVEGDIKLANLRRLSRIEGQVRGIHAMVQDDRYCADILVQVSAVQEALRGVALELLRNHLQHCAAHALKGSPDDSAKMIEELVELTRKFAR